MPALNFKAHAHDLCLTLYGLNARTNLPRETLRGIIADLRAEHLVSVQRGLFSEDGTPAGTGYHITEIGLAHLANKYRQSGTDL